MWYLASLLAFCCFVSSQITEQYVEPWVWVRGRYSDLDDTQTKFIEIKAINRVSVRSSQNFNIFETDDETYVGFSDNFDQVTHNIDSHIIQWDMHDEEFKDAGVQPRRTETGDEEDYTSIYYFQTLDGTTWAFHAFMHADDVLERYPDPRTYRGYSYLYAWGADGFESEATYSIYSQGATWRTYYFSTDDSREFLWTANFQEPYTLTGTPNCTIHEYTGEGWRQVYNLGFTSGFNCTKFPREPLVFTNVLGEWLYLDTSYATPTWTTTGALATLTTEGVPQRWWSYRTNGFYDADVIDNLSFTHINYLEHFVNQEWDYLVALTTEGIATYRLHWNTHRAQELPLIPTTHVGTHLHLFEFAGYTMLSISYGDYPGLTELTPSVHDTYFVIYYWDDVHDRWNLIQKVTSFGVIKTQTFVREDRTFLVSLSNRGHLEAHTFTTYEITEWYEDEFLIEREVDLGGYEMGKLVVDISESLDDLHHYKAMIIAIVVLLATVFLLQLILLVKGL